MKDGRKEYTGGGGLDTTVDMNGKTIRLDSTSARTICQTNPRMLKVKTCEFLPSMQWRNEQQAE